MVHFLDIEQGSYESFLFVQQTSKESLYSLEAIHLLSLENYSFEQLVVVGQQTQILHLVLVEVLSEFEEQNFE